MFFLLTNVKTNRSMSKFNNKTTTNNSTSTVTNFAGGLAYKQSDELELLSLLVTSFADNSTYRSDNETLVRLKELIKICDKKFVAQAIVYARTEFGMRSITHVAASELAKYIGGFTWAKDFYSSVIHRPDDITEILSYHFDNNGKLSNAMKKGLSKAFGKFNDYALAKYKSEGKSVKLVDALNLTHPKSTSKNGTALTELVSGTLKSFDTWESELTKAGQSTTDPVEKALLKKNVWVKLITENKIGYFALLRNLRNIIEQAPEVVDEVVNQLTNEATIKKSLVLPFRFLTAHDEIMKLESTQASRKIISAISKATDISTNNVPVFDGETLVVLDVSGSMHESGNKSPHLIGALLTAVLIKSNNADLITFSDDADYRTVNTSDTVQTIVSNLKFAAGGTNFKSIFETANKKYDRIIILSDMQGWVGYNTPTEAYNKYKSMYKCDPKVYSFDLKNYGTMQLIDDNVFALAGFSEKCFDIMKYMESDKNAFINTVKTVEFN